MIEPIIDHINTGISSLNIIESVNGLCEMVEEPVTIGENEILTRFPALYKGNDNLDYITNMDYKVGVSFHLSNGNSTPLELEKVRARERRIQRTWPMRFICIIARDIYNTDTAYSALELITNLEGQISLERIPDLKPVLQVEKIKVNATSTSHDKSLILSETFENIQFKAVHDIIVVRIEYDIVVSGPEQCFKNYGC